MSQSDDGSAPKSSSFIPPASLTTREKEILRLLAKGHTNSQIAHELFLALGTVKTHIHNIYGKLGVETRTQAILRASETGLLDENPPSTKAPQQLIQAVPPSKNRARLWIGLLSLGIATFFGVIITNGGFKLEEKQPTPTLWTATQLAAIPTASETIEPNTATPSPTATRPLPTQTDTAVPPTSTYTSTSTTTNTATATPSLTPSPTHTSSPSATPSHTPDLRVTLAQTPVTNNANWSPLIQIFGGVEMVLVPAGCFMMGSTASQLNFAGALGADPTYLTDEQPAHKQCFDEPFWLDRYEVTNAQFQQLGGQAATGSHFEGAGFPRESITWIEARDFCTLRGARLPTEREWEYAARGSSNLNFAWGNVFNANNAIFLDNSNGGLATVGSQSQGVSWVGAYDTSGNVWEWVSTIYDSARFPYPYFPNDGRENLNSSNENRVIRGGSFSNPSYKLRAAYRSLFVANQKGQNIGFRCAKDN